MKLRWNWFSDPCRRCAFRLLSIYNNYLQAVHLPANKIFFFHAQQCGIRRSLLRDAFESFAYFVFVQSLSFDVRRWLQFRSKLGSDPEKPMICWNCWWSLGNDSSIVFRCSQHRVDLEALWCIQSSRCFWNESCPQFRSSRSPHQQPIHAPTVPAYQFWNSAGDMNY